MSKDLNLIIPPAAGDGQPPAGAERHAAEDGDDDFDALVWLEERLGACRDLLAICRDYGGQATPGETAQERLDAAYREVLTITEAVMGESQWLGDALMPLVLTRVVARCGELLEAGSGARPAGGQRKRNETVER